MSQHPKTGDRVRVVTRNFEPDYQVGDTGTVESGPQALPSGGFYYVVRMDRDGPDAKGNVFVAGEIELAVSGGG